MRFNQTTRIALAALIVLAIGGAAFALLEFQNQDDDVSDNAVSSPDAPVPLAPADGAEFVDADVTLRWDWTPSLDSQQLYAVRVWYGDQPPREVWTAAPTLDAVDAIDSYARNLGSFHWQVAVVNTTPDGAFDSMGSAWSPVRTLERVRRISLTPIPAAAQSAAAQIITRQDYATSADLIDAVREFVWAHSDSDTQDNFEADYSDALALMAAHQQNGSPRPRLLCDGQATAALTLLEELGLKARLIFLYSDEVDSIREHTMLEVLNPDTQYWELHDIMFDRYFVDSHGNRASIDRLTFEALDSIVVCGAGAECTPLHASDYEFKGIFEAFRYGHSETFWVNPDRFDVTKRFPGNDHRNLAEYLTGDPRDFVFRFDSEDRDG